MKTQQTDVKNVGCEYYEKEFRRKIFKLSQTDTIPEWLPAAKRGDKSTKNFKVKFIIEHS